MSCTSECRPCGGLMLWEVLLKPDFPAFSARNCEPGEQAKVAQIALIMWPPDMCPVSCVPCLSSCCCYWGQLDTLHSRFTNMGVLEGKRLCWKEQGSVWESIAGFREHQGSQYSVKKNVRGKSREEVNLEMFTN